MLIIKNKLFKLRGDGSPSGNAALPAKGVSTDTALVLSIAYWIL